MRRALLAEAFGTFLMVGLGCGAAAWDHLHGGLGTIGVALVFGAVVGGMVWTVGPVSGAHLNPVVTLTFLLRRDATPGRALAYLAVQLAGATAGALAVRLAVADGMEAALTRPVSGLGLAAAFGWEIAVTALLVFVILVVATNPLFPQWARAVGIGTAVAVGAVVAGPLTGGSMNPARSLGPALVTAQWAHWWLYVVGPVVGALVAFVAFVGLSRVRLAIGPQAAGGDR